MTVKEIFELRKQGRIEEAYEAIRPIYATHKGRYTTLCMMWVGADMFKLRLEQGRVDEAEKIYWALERLIPSIDDDNIKSATGFMHNAEGRLIKVSEKFRKRYFAIRHAQEKKVEKQFDKFLDQFSTDFEAVRLTSNNPVASLKIPQKSNQKSSKHETERFSDQFSSDFEALEPTNTAELLSAGQTKVLDFIKSNPGLRVPMISEGLNIPSKSIERHVKALIALGLIEHRGSKKTGGYFAL